MNWKRIKEINKMKKLILISFALISYSIYSQYQNANWYMGDHLGMSFMNNNVHIVYNGQTIDPYRPTATVSDNDGNLLFYTDGHNYWDGEHSIINGSIDNIQGDVQAIRIVPYPLHPDQYYVFLYTSSGVFYSLVKIQNDDNRILLLNVDMNIPLIDPNEAIANNLLATTIASDDESYWLLVSSNNVIYSFKISRNGLSAPVSNSIDSYNIWHKYGEMILSHNPFFQTGEYLLIVPMFDSVISTDNDDYFGRLCYYKFNNTTGNLQYVSDFHDTLGLITSIEISPNDDYLYYTISRNDGYVNITQINLTSTSYLPSWCDSYTPCNIIHDETLNSTDLANFRAATLRMAMNNKIYFPSYVGNKMSVIENPNQQNCNFSYNSIYFQTGSTYKLPALVDKHISACLPDLTININVDAGQTDIRATSNSITAINTIFDGGTADYTAGNYILLSPGFYSKTNSNTHLYIEGCHPNTYNKPDIDTDELTSDNRVNNAMKPKMGIYPNPTIDGDITISAPKNKGKGAAYISFYDINGLKIFETQLKNQSQKISLKGLKKGIYLVKYMDDHQILESKLIVR